jgi:hypothetical protein
MTPVNLRIRNVFICNLSITSIIIGGKYQCLNVRQAGITKRKPTFITSNSSGGIVVGAATRLFVSFAVVTIISRGTVTTVVADDAQQRC